MVVCYYNNNQTVVHIKIVGVSRVKLYHSFTAKSSRGIRRLFMKSNKEQQYGYLEDVFMLKEVIHAAERELLRSTMDNGTAICEDASIEDADLAVRDYYMACRTAYYL